MPNILSSPTLSRISAAREFRRINPKHLVRLMQRDQMLSTLRRNLLTAGVPKEQLSARVRGVQTVP